MSKHRPLPEWHARPFIERPAPDGDGPEVVLLADTFSTWFEPDNLRAALTVLRAGGYCVHVARPAAGDPAGARPLCCGRTFLAVGAVEQAREEAARTLAVLAPYAERGAAIIDLEPSCLFTLRDEWTVLLSDDRAVKVADAAMTFESFLVRERDAGRLTLPLRDIGASKALVHGHCHQKAFGAADAVREVLAWIPDLTVEAIESTCCGMAGAFGYQAETYDISMQIGGLDLFPAIGAVPDDVLIVADGTSCRHQIADGVGRQACHAALALAEAVSVERN